MAIGQLAPSAADQNTPWHHANPPPPSHIYPNPHSLSRSYPPPKGAFGQQFSGGGPAPGLGHPVVLNNPPPHPTPLLLHTSPHTHMQEDIVGQQVCQNSVQVHDLNTFPLPVPWLRTSFKCHPLLPGAILFRVQGSRTWQCRTSISDPITAMMQLPATLPSIHLSNIPQCLGWPVLPALRMPTPLFPSLPLSPSRPEQRGLVPKHNDACPRLSQTIMICRLFSVVWVLFWLCVCLCLCIAPCSRLSPLVLKKGDVCSCLSAPAQPPSLLPGWVISSAACLYDSLWNW